MKRILSVILSLVLLVSVLVIPMTTSAYFNYAKNNYDCTVEQVDKETYAYNSGEGNLILGKFPQGYYKTAGIERTAYSHPNFAFLTDGDLTSKMIGVPTGVFADSNNNLPNGYKGETQKYNFDEAVITNYEDLVFDLGGKCEITAFINFDTQVWHAPGLYQVYVAETEADLFTSESHVLNYQRGSENELSPKFVFNGEKKPVGRYFGIRYLAAVTPSWGGGDAYALRIAEFAVYGNSLEVATTVFNVGNEGNTYYNNGGTIISHGISPVYQYTSPDNGREIAAGNTYYGTRIPSLTDGDISKRYDLPTSGFGTSGVNGYFYYGQAGYTKNYDFKNNKIDTYADMIFDFGGVASIDKIQLFSEDGQLTTTLYQIYASTDANKLFDEESNVLNYQAVDLSGGSWSFNGGQQHVFSRAITARYVAIRVVHPTIDGFGAGNVRIKEIAIYGTNDSDYNVVKSAPGFPGDSVTVASVSNPGAQNLLGLDKLTVTYCNNGTETEFTDFSDAIYNRLHDGGAGSNVDFYGASFNNEDGTLKNGYNITLNSSGKVSFTRNTNVPIDNYTCFTYDLGNYYNLSELQWFSYNGKDFTNTLKTQAYEVYVGNDKDTLYTDPNNKVLEYNNYFNMQGQIFTFNKKTVGRYLGVKVLMAALDNGTLGNYCRISEIAAYGTEVMPADFKANGSIDLWSDGIYYEDNDTEHATPKTAVYLTAQYKTPMKSGTNSADSTKVVLENGAVASVVSRTFYVATKDTADTLGDNFGKEDVQTKVKAITNTGSELAGYWKKSVADANGNVNTSYGACVKNIQSARKGTPFAIRAKLVYKVGDHEHTVYSDVVTSDNFSAQGAYDALGASAPIEWFK